MIVEQKIELHKKSEKYLEDFKDLYEETNILPKQIKGRCLIHMYASEDTNDDSDCGKGFCDVLNCTLYIYNTDDMTVYKTETHDQLNITVPCQIRIFKDLSTMAIIDGGVELGNYQSFDVYRLKNTI